MGEYIPMGRNYENENYERPNHRPEFKIGRDVEKLVNLNKWGGYETDQIVINKMINLCTYYIDNYRYLNNDEIQGIRIALFMQIKFNSSFSYLDVEKVEHLNFHKILQKLISHSRDISQGYNQPQRRYSQPYPHQQNFNQQQRPYNKPPYQGYNQQNFYRQQEQYNKSYYHQQSNQQNFDQQQRQYNQLSSPQEYYQQNFDQQQKQDNRPPCCQENPYKDLEKESPPNRPSVPNFSDINETNTYSKGNLSIINQNNQNFNTPTPEQYPNSEYNSNKKTININKLNNLYNKFKDEKNSGK